jgi:hypothetical protein
VVELLPQAKEVTKTMTLSDVEAKETALITCGNASAGEFLRLWRSYVHAIDDIVDGDRKGNEALLETFMLAAFVYTPLSSWLTCLRFDRLLLTARTPTLILSCGKKPKDGKVSLATITGTLESKW